jgi:hypothetical protein
MLKKILKKSLGDLYKRHPVFRQRLQLGSLSLPTKSLIFGESPEQLAIPSQS